MSLTESLFNHAGPIDQVNDEQSTYVKSRVVNHFNPVYIYLPKHICTYIYRTSYMYVYVKNSKNDDNKLSHISITEIYCWTKIYWSKNLETVENTKSDILNFF